MKVLDNMIINCDIKNNCAKFINHCCDPNCVLEIKDHEAPPPKADLLIILAGTKLFSRHNSILQGL